MDDDDFHDFEDCDDDAADLLTNKSSGAHDDGDSEDDEWEPLDPSLKNLMDQESLAWVFVGGKGGVGKTTTSCSIGTKLARDRPGKKTLIISTDPAHNVSDAFNQKFGKDPVAVEGFDNLFAMEIEAKIDKKQLLQGISGSGAGGSTVADPSAGLTGGVADDIPENASGMMAVMQELTSAIPGIDEAMSFAELMKQVQQMHYDTIVFDTAPTGHTLRLLSFPTVLDNAIGKLLELKSKFSGMLKGAAAMMGGAMGNVVEQQTEALVGKLTSMREIIQQVNKLFRDPNKTTFVCVAIPEFLSLYETERLVQELAKFDIDTHNIVVNQVLMPRDWDYDQIKEPSWADNTCRARIKMQRKYLNQFEDLYEDFHIIRMPLLEVEVRGIKLLDTFGTLLFEPGTDKAEEAKGVAKQLAATADAQY